MTRDQVLGAVLMLASAALVLIALWIFCALLFALGPEAPR